MSDRYIKNPLGAVHSVTEEHYQSLLEVVEDTGDKYLPHGWSEVKEAEARKANPQLFGAPDPRVVRSAAEMKAEFEISQYRDGAQPADVEQLVQERVAAAVQAALEAQQQPQPPQK